MVEWLNLNLFLAVALVVLALGFFGWHLVSTTRRVGLLMSESRVPRRWLVLGFVVGLGILYVARR
jgi:hypothetical protein